MCKKTSICQTLSKEFTPTSVQKIGSFTNASSAKAFASVKTYMFLLLGVGVVKLLSAYKLLKNKVKN